ncbi:DUF4339 domain-containing protein, partial [Halobacteriovorax sp.]|uniref:DUF4339 domain-containing protein n=1 Tax=Halobacteriovorax sp. TaxID=2020862 RepID=UPI00356368AE
MDKTWFIFQSDHHLGPFSTVEVLEMLDSGKIDDEVPLWKEGVDNWRPLKEFEEFYPIADEEEEILPDVEDLEVLPPNVEEVIDLFPELEEIDEQLEVVE